MDTKKLKIIIPDNNLEERFYIIKTIIKDFLNIDYAIETSSTETNYRITYDKKTILIKDAFFNLHKKSKSYLKQTNIPQKLTWFEYGNIRIPIIYGSNKLKLSHNFIECFLDIFASSFFMLSRWEEFVIKQKDEHGRCPEEEMFAVKHGIYEIAVVNEYCRLFEYLLKHINFAITDKSCKFEVLPTHDIDFLFQYKSVLSLFRKLVGDLLRRKSITKFFFTLKNYAAFKTGKAKDPFDTFDFYMNLSEKYGYKSAFYFIPSVKGEKDAEYSIFDKAVKQIINKITARNHEIGIHFSKNTFENDRIFSTEYNRLKLLHGNIKGGRNHFLLYDLPKSLRNWQKYNLEYDCGLGFHSKIGFRCGTCYPYRFFDVEAGKTLKITEKPLLVMDVAAYRYKRDEHNIIRGIKNIVDIVAEHKGLFVILWHNAFFNPDEKAKMIRIYKKVLEYCNIKKISDLYSN